MRIRQAMLSISTYFAQKHIFQVATRQILVHYAEILVVRTVAKERHKIFMNISEAQKAKRSTRLTS
jgi:hypothetical protein